MKKEFANFKEFYPFYIDEHKNKYTKLGWAWFGLFFIEKNKPATFKYPFYSAIGDWVMFSEILRGKHKIF